LGYFEEEEYGYRVDLEAFSGPLDLLLYLIRQEEVEIADIPIARITDAYLQHLELMQQINVNLAGEFLLMAATLMEIKSRMLLPRPEGGEEEPEDPRADLIRQLLEYKKFKDAARMLAGRADEQVLKFTRGAAAALGLPERQPDENLPIVLGELSVWDLMTAFQQILRQTALPTTGRILLDEKPASAYCNELLGMLRERRTATFRELFDPAVGRMALIHAFMALLELIRRRRVRAEQAGPHGEIRILLLDATPVSEGELTEVTRPPEPQPAAGEAPAPPPAEPEEPSLSDGELEAIFVPEVEADAELAPDAAEEEGEVPAIIAEIRRRRAAAKGRPARARPKEEVHPAQAIPLRRRPPRSLLARLPRCAPLRRCARTVGVVRRRR
jgi:segregation and condensation protein A